MSTFNIKLSDTTKVDDKLKLRSFIEDRIAAGPKKTRIVVRNHDTGEILADTTNKIVVSGSYLNGAKLFGLDLPSEQIFPSYDKQMEMDTTISDVEHSDDPIVCLFCVDDSGCGSEQKDVYKNTNKDRIVPIIKRNAETQEWEPITDLHEATGQMIMPFRFVDADADLNSDLRKFYFGRKEYEFDGNNKIAYFFKKFDTAPQLHIQLADGTQITDNVFDIETSQSIECFVETRLRITRADFRDYFDQVLGWDHARVSSVSLLFGTYKIDGDDITWFENVRPYTKLNFPFQWLVDLTIAIDFDYQIFY